jgi:6-phosphogluconolactonase (cycloisomerase 2 family)
MIGSVLQYAIDGSGTWTALTPASVQLGYDPVDMAIHPSGRFAYAVNSNSTMGNTISQFAIGSDGKLAALSPATIATGKSPLSIAVHPSGRFAYAVNSFNNAVTGNSVSQYSINSDGTLKAMTTATVATGAAPQTITIDPSGRFAYVTNDLDGNLSQYTIDAGDGHLTALAATPSAGPHPVWSAIDPLGRYAYALDQNNCNLWQFSIGADGSLGALSPTNVAVVGTCTQGVTAVVVDPSSSFVYVTDQAATSAVFQFSIGNGGPLAPLSPASTTRMTATFQDLTISARYQ